MCNFRSDRSTRRRPSAAGKASSSEAGLWVLRLSCTSTICLASGKCASDNSLRTWVAIDAGLTLRHLDLTPAFHRREDHEQVGGAIALILVVKACGPPRLRRDRPARLGDELLRCLVHVHHGAGWIVRPPIHLQRIFHAGYEGRVGVRRDDPLLLQVGLESILFSVRPIVRSLARSTMFSSTTAVSSSFNVHRARPLGGSEQATAISLASAAPSQTRFLADAGIQRRGDLAVTPSLASLGGISLAAGWSGATCGSAWTQCAWHRESPTNQLFRVIAPTHA